MKKKTVQLFAGVLLIKLSTVLLWLLITLIIRGIFLPVKSNLTQAGLTITLVELFIGLAPVYLIWAGIFTLIRLVWLDSKNASFPVILFLALSLNLSEILFSFGHFDRIVRAIKYNGFFNAKSWSSLPDYPEVLSAMIASTVFTLLYFKFVEKKPASTNS